MGGDPALLLLMSARVPPSAAQLARLAGSETAATAWVKTAFDYDHEQAERLGRQLAAALAQIAPITARDNARAARG